MMARMMVRVLMSECCCGLKKGGLQEREQPSKPGYQSFWSVVGRRSGGQVGGLFGDFV